MMWQEVNLLYELKSPVHIGYLPSKSGVINPTRYYIPGKNFWGGYTKVLTEALFNTPDSSNYFNVGEWFKENVRFTYFYIYDEDSNSLLCPNYSEDGLNYGDMSLSEFQNRFIGSFISAAIDKKVGTTKDESLHEIEYINWKYPTGKGTKNTKTFGKMFVKKKFSTGEIKDVSDRIKLNDKGITVDNKDPFRAIFVGGELNYGFGMIERLSKIPKPKYDNLEFNLNSDEVRIKLEANKPILAHLCYTERDQFSGDVELISGRGYKKEEETHENPGMSIAQPKLYFTPGTSVKGDITVSVDEYGRYANRQTC